MQEDAASNRAIKDDKTSTKKSPDLSDSSIPTGSTLEVRSPKRDAGSRPSISPRRATLDLIGSSKAQVSPTHSLRVPKKVSRPSLQSTATTAVSLADIETQLRPDGSQRTSARSLKSMRSLSSLRVDTPSGRHRSRATSETDETASVRSLAPTVGATTDAESILGDLLVTDQRIPGWKFLNEPAEKEAISIVPFDAGEPTADFNREFDEIPEIDADGSNEGKLKSPVMETYD